MRGCLGWAERGSNGRSVKRHKNCPRYATKTDPTQMIRVGLGRAAEPGSLPLLETDAASLNEQEVAVVEHAIEDGRGDQVVAEDEDRLRDALADGAQAAALVASADEREKQVCGLLLEGRYRVRR